MNNSKLKLYINRDKASPKEMKNVFTSIQNPKVLAEKGGFLFRSSINEKEFHIGIIPNFNYGERGHHYDIELKYTDEFRLTGFFNTDGSLNILFTPPDNKEDITSEYKTKIKSAYRRTAELFITYGFNPDISLDWITQKILEELKTFSPIPKVLSDFT